MKLKDYAKKLLIFGTLLASCRNSVENFSFGMHTLAFMRKLFCVTDHKASDKDVIDRSRFLEDVLGMREDEFRVSFGWDERDSVCRFTKNKEFLQAETMDNKAWIQGHQRRTTLFAGSYNFLSINELSREIEKRVEAGENPSLGTARFRIVVHDPLDKKGTDIRALQADPKNNKAVFQISSTPFAVEPGMVHGDESLSEMLFGHAHGALAAAAVAGAAIFRKYIRPTFRPTGERAYDYLWHYLAEQGIATIYGTSYSIDENSIKDYQYNDEDVSKVAVGVHDGIFVTNAYSGLSGGS